MSGIDNDPRKQHDIDMDKAIKKGRETGNYTDLHNIIGLHVSETSHPREQEVYIPARNFEEQKERVRTIINESKLGALDKLTWLNNLDKMSLQDAFTSREILSAWTTDILKSMDQADNISMAYSGSWGEDSYTIRRVSREVHRLFDFLKSA